MGEIKIRIMIRIRRQNPRPENLRLVPEAGNPYLLRAGNKLFDDRAKIAS
jgi:hypothetical protein